MHSSLFRRPPRWPDDRWATDDSKSLRSRIRLKGLPLQIEGIWLVSFMDYDLGYIDLEDKTLQPLDNPFGPTVSPMYPVLSVTYVSGPDIYMIYILG
jgi:hypothetical protein